MSESSCVTVFLLCAATIGWAQQGEAVVQVGGTFLPAGTLLGCTLDEPNFSTQTARPGDPVLCRTTSVEMFGRQMIPRGAYLSAHLEDYRDPGHFIGKGWIQLEFTSLTLPGGSFPLNAKVISAGRYRVNGDGKIQGRGHATRDAVEWAIPILWPMKVLTLPARGPRPGFKGETRIELRLMEDMMIPESAGSGFGRLTPRSSAYQPETYDNRTRLNGSRSEDIWSANLSLPAQKQPMQVERYRTTPATKQARPSTQRPRLTLLVLRGGRMYLVADYWVDNGNLDYTTGGGALQALPLGALDMPMTRKLNAERGVPFILAAKNR
jgi:hypothetical protein